MLLTVLLCRRRFCDSLDGTHKHTLHRPPAERQGCQVHSARPLSWCMAARQASRTSHGQARGSLQNNTLEAHTAQRNAWLCWERAFFLVHILTCQKRLLLRSTHGHRHRLLHHTPRS